MFNNKKRAFYNATSQMSIGALPQEDTINFLQDKFVASNISMSTEMAKYLIAVTTDVPHYIQLLAAEVWQYMINSRKTVTKKIVDICVTHVIELKRDYYMELFDHCSRSQKQLLIALTENGKNIFSTAYINTHRLPSAATLQRAAKDLTNDGIIEKTNDEYIIADPFFKIFLAI
jgi:hypothetical protein